VSALGEPTRRTNALKSPDQVKSMIATKLAADALPVDPPSITAPGPGSGAPCDACEEPIRPHDMECACEFPLHSSLRFHVDCFAEWRRQQDTR
jgi:hypothetical protein